MEIGPLAPGVALWVSEMWRCHPSLQGAAARAVIAWGAITWGDSSGSRGPCLPRGPWYSRSCLRLNGSLAIHYMLIHYKIQFAFWPRGTKHHLWFSAQEILSKLAFLGPLNGRNDDRGTTPDMYNQPLLQTPGAGLGPIPWVSLCSVWGITVSAPLYVLDAGTDSRYGYA